MMPDGADALARRCATAMAEGDRATKTLGAELVEVGAGRARMEMDVTEAMSNGHGMCHGGFIFALADTAFAYACNTYGDAVVAAHCSIDFLRPGRVGDRLVAVAQERVRGKRSGIYDVSVTGPDGSRIAEFRGNSRAIGRFLDGSP